MVEDVSEQVRVEQELAFKAHLLASISDAVIGTSPPEFRITAWNRAAEAIYGWKAEEVLGRRVQEVIRWRDDDGGSREEMLRELAETGQLLFEAIQERKDGQPIHVEGHATALRDGSGRTIGYVSVNRDITERKRLERERSRVEHDLREANERLQGLIRASPLAIIATDRASPQGNVTLWNPAAERLFGWSEQEVLGRPNPIVPDEELERVQRLRERAMQGTELTGVEVRRLRKDGALVDVSLSFAALRDEAGAAQGTIVVFEDISERKRLEKQLRQAQKMEALGQLAGGVAHDFNNLLTAILAYADFGLKHLAPETGGRAEFEGIRATAERASGLTRQLLAIGRGRLVQPQPLDLSELVGSMEGLLRRTIGEEIDLVTRLEQQLVVLVDRSQMEQVVLNLAINARDAMPGGGTLRLRTQAVTLDADYSRSHLMVDPGEYALLSVEDTGIGMDEATRQKALEPFFTTKDETRGSGLGLSTSYGIVRQAGGTVWLYSEPGLGTTVKVYLPRVEVAVREEKRVRSPGQARSAGGTLLVVEDDDLLRALIEAILVERGYRVVPAARAEEAITRFEELHARVDLLLSDVVMPGMRGHELALRLRARLPTLPIVFMSGYAGETIELGEPTIDARLIEKPFNPDALAQTVEDALADIDQQD